MTKSTARPRGTCPVCGKSIRIKQDGTLFFHGATRRIPGDRYFGGGFCRGVRKPPIESGTTP